MDEQSPVAEALNTATTETPIITNELALTVSNLSIVLADGSHLSRARLIGLGSSSGAGNLEPVYRLAIGQPADAIDEAVNSFYLTRNIWEDPEAEAPRRDRVFGFGKSISVVPIGYTFTRSMGEYVQDKGKFEEYCQSEDFFYPAERFKGQRIPNSAGTVATVCMIPEHATNKNGELIFDKSGKPVIKRTAVCPMAMWHKVPETKDGQPVIDPKTGKQVFKNIRPMCSEVYTVFAAIQHPDTDEWYLCEITHKISTAAEGALILKQLGALEEEGKPLYTHPLEYSLATYLQGNTKRNSFTGKMIKDAQTNEIVEAMGLRLAEMTDEFEKAMKWRKARAEKPRQPVQTEGNANGEKDEIPFDTAPAAPPVPRGTTTVESTKPTKKSAVKVEF